MRYRDLFFAGATTLGIMVLCLADADARAQGCDRSCPADQKDAHGCCQARPAAPVAPPKPAAPACTEGKEISPDTAGHCCWAGQVWASGRCVGVPTTCPEGRAVDRSKQECMVPACPTGLVRTDDKLHCCWPGQGWSVTRSACIGVPQCPRSFELEGDTCVSEDKDNDGIPNRSDQCPNEPEDKNGYKDDDGCPDEPERAALVAANLRREREEAQERARLAEEERQRAAAAEKARLEEEERKRQEQARLQEQERQRQEEIRLHEEEEKSKAGRRTTGLIIGGVGLGSAAVGLTFFALAKGQATKITDGGLATAADIESASSTGKTFNTVGIVGVVGGAIGLGIGVPYFLKNLPDDKATSATTTVKPVAGGFVLSRTWSLQ